MCEGKRDEEEQHMYADVQQLQLMVIKNCTDLFNTLL